MIALNKRPELKADLETRTGLEIVKIEVGSINFLNDTAKILIYYKPLSSSNYLEESLVNDEDED